MEKFNRVHSGVKTQNGRPCKTGLFGQKFWDTYPFNFNTDAMLPDGWQADKKEQYLETDEWPMATFENPEFDEDADPIQHSLRCITAASNKAGGNMWANFLSGAGPYNSDKSSEGYKKHRGKWSHHRKVLGALDPGDWFFANPNFDSFDASNSTHQNIMK